MKIVKIIPFHAPPWLVEMQRDFLPPDVDVISVTEDAPAGEGRSDVSYTAGAVLDAIKDAEKKGYDAVICGGVPDPNLQEARELVDIPVVGQGMAAIHLASMLGHRLCIFAPSLPLQRWMFQNVVQMYGFESRTVMRHMNATALQSAKEYGIYKASSRKITPFLEIVIEECLKVIREDDCGTLTFACGGLMWTTKVLQDELKKRGYGATVINPAAAAAEIARALVNLKLTHSRISYPRIVRYQEPVNSKKK